MVIVYTINRPLTCYNASLVAEIKEDMAIEENLITCNSTADVCFGKVNPLFELLTLTTFTGSFDSLQHLINCKCQSWYNPSSEGMWQQNRAGKALQHDPVQLHHIQNVLCLQNPK